MQCIRVGENLLQIGDKRYGVTASQCQRKRLCLQQHARTVSCEHDREGSESKQLLSVSDVEGAPSELREDYECISK